MAKHRLDQKFRDRLTKARGSVSQSILAGRIGLNGQPDVSKIERGPLNEIDDELLLKYAEATGRPYEWLLTGKGDDGKGEPVAAGGAAAQSPLSPFADDINTTGQSVPPHTVMNVARPTHVEGSVSRSTRDVFGFIRSLDLPTVERFMIMAITGESTVKDFLNAIEEHLPRLASPIECRVLLRSPYSTDKKRSDAFDHTKRALRSFHARYPGFNFEIRTYSSSVPLHAIMCEHRDRTFSGCVSSYMWRSLNSRETISTREPVTRERVAENDPVLEVYLLWFAHFWGRRKIHTILFDFDDTLFLTTQAQVEAWIYALKYGLDRGFLRETQLKNGLAKLLRSKAGASDLMTSIFLDEQDEEHIAARIFKKGVSSESFELTRAQRTRKREQLTRATAAPIAGTLTDVRELRSNYQLVIVSATSETLINRILEDHDLGIFSYVIGREALRRQSWQFIEHKAQHFIRVSNMLGIPLERMIFVGDSDADFRAAHQLGLNYIESRHNAARHGRKSLIKTPGVTAPHFISGDARPGELLTQVAKIEAEIADG